MSFLESALKELGAEVVALKEQARSAESERDDLILQALADGWTQARIAECAGVTRGRVNQIARRETMRRVS